MAVRRIRHHHILTFFLCFFVTLSLVSFTNRQYSFQFFGDNYEKEIETDENFRLRDAELEFNKNYSEYLELLGFYDKFEPIDVSNPPDFTLVTAFSENHWAEGRHLIVNTSRAFSGRKIVVYGLDLSQKAEEWMKNACNVDFRRFNMSRFPNHVKVANYRFKPLVVAEALREFGAIMWTDTSTLWLGRDIPAFREQLKALKPDPKEPSMYIFTWSGHSTYAATNPEMYKFLPQFTNETLHKRIMYESGKIVIYRTPATVKLALKWWVLCALEEGCMAPSSAKLGCDLRKVWIDQYAGCHRYDQSAINLILAPYEKSFLPQDMIHGFVSTARGTMFPENTKVVCK